MRQSENGASSSDRLTQTACAADLLDPATDGTLDEVFLRINGRLHYLWRAVDQDGDVLDILVQSRRDKKAAKKFFLKLLKGLRYVPRVNHHRQAEELQRGKGCRDAERRTPAAEVSEQPSREFASTNQVAGACDEAIQVSRSGTAFSLSLWDHHVTLPTRATPL
jgi:transposase-like protein